MAGRVLPVRNMALLVFFKKQCLRYMMMLFKVILRPINTVLVIKGYKSCCFHPKASVLGLWLEIKKCPLTSMVLL